MPSSPRLAVIGLGYVGLPLAVALARRFEVIGIDVDEARVDEIERHHDRTGEVTQQVLAESALRVSSRPGDASGREIYIVTVPTPVDSANRPDLGALLSATRTVAGLIDASVRPTIIYESTVYPGVTEDLCGPEIERVAGLVRGRDFRLAYSPERINPGDTVHRVDVITKVIAGEDAEVVEQLAELYGSITTGGVHRAASIRVAEAAKAIENAQRDINIAFVNEVAQICQQIDISVWDVLDAARSKWNFLPFEPGLVGGHCIGVDPYYLSHLAQSLGHNPQVILAGRDTNDSMGGWIADRLHDRCGGAGRALVLGLTFKENVPDLRNSRSFDIVERLKELGWTVAGHDPVASATDLAAMPGLDIAGLDSGPHDLLIAAVGHDAYRAMASETIRELVAQDGMIADIKGIWRDRSDLDPARYWTL